MDVNVGMSVKLLSNYGRLPCNVIIVHVVKDEQNMTFMGTEYVTVDCNSLE